MPKNKKAENGSQVKSLTVKDALELLRGDGFVKPVKVRFKPGATDPDLDEGTEVWIDETDFAGHTMTLVADWTGRRYKSS